MVVGEDDGLVEGCTMERVMACRRRHKQGFWEIFLARKKPNEKVGELDICGWGGEGGRLLVKTVSIGESKKEKDLRTHSP